MNPILTAHPFPAIEGHLLELLRSLSQREWELQTVVQKWTVKDVAAHLLDTHLRKLSRVRDDYTAEPPVSRHRSMCAGSDSAGAAGVGGDHPSGDRVANFHEGD